MRLLISLLLFSFSLFASEKVALVIANKSYKNQTGLKNPIKDAKLIKATLEDMHFEVLEAYDKDLNGLGNKLDEFIAKAQNAKVAVVYYAGHGVGVDGKNYLIPLGATNLSRATLPKKLISLDELKEAVSSSKRFGVIFFDACRNSFFSGKIRGLNGNRGSRALVQPQASSKNILISFSTQAGQLAKDNVGNAKHSPYAIALSEKLKLKKDIRLVMGGVKERVEKLTNYEQVPISRSSLGEDFFCLTGCGKTPPPPPPTPTPKPISTSKWIKPTDSVCRANGGKIDKHGVCQANWENAKKICSASGGQLPSRDDLKQVVVDCGGIWNSVGEENRKNTSYQVCYKQKSFGNKNAYWTRETLIKGSSDAWAVVFYDGDDGWLDKTNNSYALCVR